MTAIGPAGGSYVYPSNVMRFNDGSVIATAELKLEDRNAWAQAAADSYNRSDDGKIHPKTVEEVLRQDDESERMKLKMALGMEAFLAGEGVPVNGTTQEMYARAIEEVSAARGKPYRYHSGPVVIEALNVSSAVNAQKALTGGDLKLLTRYGQYLRNEVAAATKVRSDVSFRGVWGKDRVTSDVNEYIGWLMQVMKQSSTDGAGAKVAQA